jgi:hypothetical protein
MKTLYPILCSFLVLSFCYFFALNNNNSNQSIIDSELEISNSSEEIPLIKDTTQVKFFFSKNEGKIDILSKMKDSIEVLEMELRSLQKKEPTKPRKIKVGGYQQFELFFDVVEFPALAGYDDILFELKDPITSIVDSLFSVTWDSLSLIQDKESDGLMMHLIESDKNYFLTVIPCIQEGPLFDKALNVFMKKLSKFQKKVRRLLRQKGDIKYRYKELLKKWHLNIEKIENKY